MELFQEGSAVVDVMDVLAVFLVLEVMAEEESLVGVLEGRSLGTGELFVEEEVPGEVPTNLLLDVVVADEDSVDLGQDDVVAVEDETEVEETAVLGEVLVERHVSQVGQGEQQLVHHLSV